MQLNEAIKLIQQPDYIPKTPVKWADLGCGTGLFTRALATQLPADSIIYAVDTNQSSLAGMADYNGVTIKTICQDFVRNEWSFEGLDGILMANSLHYVQDKLSFIQKAKRHLAKSGRFLLVEYDTDIPNRWVPYPVSYLSLRSLFENSGYSAIEKLSELPSIYNKANLYSASVVNASITS